jgi:hypothetical protein
MEPHDNPSPVAWDASGREASDISVAELIGQAYASASETQRGLLLEELLRPLSVLSLMAVADGIFAKVRFRAGWPDPHVRSADIECVRADDVIALVEHVQRISGEVIAGWVEMVAQSAVSTQGCDRPFTPS